MSKKKKLRIISIFFAWIFVCAIFVGAVEGQATLIERNDVVVSSSETEIIESTYTDKGYNRIFHIDNGEYEIIATIWGSNDEQNWVYWDSDTIDSGKTDTMVLGNNHYWYVKLTGRTIGSPDTTSIVDASLTYHIPD